MGYIQEMNNHGEKICDTTPLKVMICISLKVMICISLKVMICISLVQITED